MSNLFDQVRRVLLGHAEVVDVEHIIDCDADPFVPDGLAVEEHRRGGAFKWKKNAQQNALYLSKKQRIGRLIQGYELRRELESKPVLNANVLDYLIANPHLIPEEWIGKAVGFWGTIFRSQVDDHLCVRYLLCGGGTTQVSGIWWLDCELDDVSPAAISAS